MGVQKPVNPRGPIRRVFGRCLVAVAAFVLLAAVAAAQQTVYVKVNDAKVRSGATADATVVASPAKGASLTVVATEGPRYKVRTADGKEGYISRLHVSTTKPDSGGGTLSGIGRSEVKANEAQTVASIRGLSPAAKTLAQNQGLSAQAVQFAEKMESESAKVSDAQVENFLQAEKIGL